MPIEIKELVIRATAVRTEERAGKSLSPAAKAARTLPQVAEREQLIQDCVREVMRILRQGEEP